VSESALVDTGFWIALFDAKEPLHRQAIEHEDLLELLTVIVPWPTVYETMRTRFVKRTQWLMAFDRLLKRPNAEFIDDRPYRDEAYALTVDYSTRFGRPISMVDMLCRLLIADATIRVDYMLTTNARDFRDVCISRRVRLLFEAD